MESDYPTSAARPSTNAASSRSDSSTASTDSFLTQLPSRKASLRKCRSVRLSRNGGPSSGGACGLKLVRFEE